MTLAVAAFGAVVAALLELTIVPYLQIGGVQPDLVLVVAIVWTMAVGLESGLVWAFVGGLMIDVLAARPLGSTAFSLLVCVGAAVVLRRVLDPLRLLGPAVATLLLAGLYSVLVVVTYSALRNPLPVADLPAVIASRSLYDGVLGGLVGGGVLWWRNRRAERERLDW
jgi:rod shape-determining protein MreD